MLTNIQKISLQIMTLTPKCEHVETTHGVPITVTGVVHCKIMSNDEFLPLAAEQFLGKNTEHIKSVILHTLEGHMRAVIGTQTVEAIYRQRQNFAGLIREAAATDLTRMGIDIMSLTIKDISDNVEYLSSLGKKSTAKVKCDAAMHVAKAEGEAIREESSCDKEILQKRYEKDTAVEGFNHATSMRCAEFANEVGKKKAEARLAYDLHWAKTQKIIRQEELKVEELKIDGQIEIEKEECLRCEKQFEMDVTLPAKAEAYAIEKNAEACAQEVRIRSEAEAERMKTIGSAEAVAIERLGTAEAEGMKLKAESYKKFGDAAILSDLLIAIPKIAAELAAPLSKIEDIVLISGGSTNAANAAEESASLPAAIKAVGKDQQFSPNLIKRLVGSQITNN